MNELFLCAKCAGVMQHSFGTDEVPNSFGNEICEMCKKKRFGCKYIVRR